jgi:Protein  of unknown function (DUF3018)
LPFSHVLKLGAPRAAGLWLVQIGGIGTQQANYARERRRQSRSIKKADSQESAVLDRLQAVADTQGRNRPGVTGSPLRCKAPTESQGRR